MGRKDEHDAGVKTRDEHVTSKAMEKRGVVLPDTDIFEDAENFCLLADLPGVEKSSVDIKLEKGVLTLQGAAAARDHEGRPVQWETGGADYRRSFRLTDAIDADRIEAKMENGVLHLTLPKAEPARPKKIAVTPS